MTAPAPDPSEHLQVIGLVSGGKDSFFSLLHCAAHGHRLVALANLHPQGPPGDASRGGAATGGAETTVVRPSGGDGSSTAHTSDAGRAGARDAAPEAGPHASEDPAEGSAGDEETDLNSFMFQTVGHEVLPLYAAATGLPLYRRVITGRAVQQGREYADPATLARPGEGSPDAGPPSGGGLQGEASQAAGDEDETESMLHLLRAVLAAHPEANALSAGAILSTYQRTRVEAVAARLGLVPLAYLWNFPVLPSAALPGAEGPPPPPGGEGPDGDDAQLLRDMGAAGLEARIVKVASGGLDEGFLWTDVAGPAAPARLRHAARRFGAAERGAVLGEGGEFETLVLDGPPALFRGRIVVEEADRRVVREGGGSAWLKIRRARVVPKAVDEAAAPGEGGLVRMPALLDEKFLGVLDTLLAEGIQGLFDPPEHIQQPSSDGTVLRVDGDLKATASHLLQRRVVADPTRRSSLEEETHSVVENIKSLLSGYALPPTSVINTVVVLSRMADFPAFNKIYGSLFPHPNPPARVTVSVGTQALPEGLNVAVFLTILNGNEEDISLRSGLHVQSRSYWAPANIGPYSQAVAIPVSTLFPPRSPGQDDGGPRLVSIAGQIPLMPATMALPPDYLPLDAHIILALQHLWRVGAATGVQWWSSAVVYMPRPAAGEPGLEHTEKAVLAAKTWHALHAPPARDEDDEDDEAEDDEADADGPDLWDRKFDARHKTHGGERVEAVIPDRAVLDGDDDAVPYVFLAEVAELPRAAKVEWHAHVGFGGVGAGRIRCAGPSPVAGGDGVRGVLQHTILQTAHGLFIQSTLALEQDLPSLADLPLEKWFGDTLEGVVGWRSELEEVGLLTPELAYVDFSAIASPAEQPGLGSAPVLPCFSLWDSQGKPLAAVLIFRTVLQKTSRDVDDT